MIRMQHWNFCSRLCYLKWGGPASWYSHVERSREAPLYRGSECTECQTPLTWAPRLTDEEVMELLSTRAQVGGGFHGVKIRRAA